MRTLKFTIFGIFLAVSLSSHATPVGNAFTYQGELKQAGELADGPYDFQFMLFDEVVDGVLLAGPVELGDVSVQEGVFTVELDFGAGAFNGEQLWLSIGVREADGDVYTLLEPRQKLTLDPYTAGMEVRLKTLECQFQGLANCGGICIDTGEDTENCGGCGIICEVWEACVAGECLENLCPIGIDCGDDDACTADSCDQLAGCVHTVINCEDQDACTIDSCGPIAGCIHTALDCNDGNQCTIDDCSPIFGCQSTPDTSASCDDSDSCTTDDMCGPEGICTGQPIDCNDNLSCTVDSCDGTGACDHTIVEVNCLIDGVCYDSGDVNSSDASLSCQPLVSQTSWTPIP